MLVSIQAEKVVAVRGNPDHPFTKGRLCVKVNNYQDRVNSTDRILHPLRRVGPKGAGEFQQVTWNEAIRTVADKWKEIIRTSGPKAILPYSYLGTQGILNGLTVGDAFFNKLGASIAERTFCDSGDPPTYSMPA